MRHGLVTLPVSGEEQAAGSSRLGGEIIANIVGEMG